MISEKLNLTGDHPAVFSAIARAVADHLGKLKPGPPQLEATIKK